MSEWHRSEMALNHALMAGLAVLGLSALAGLGALSVTERPGERIASAGKTDRIALDPMTTASVPQAAQVSTPAETARLGAALEAVHAGRIGEARDIAGALPAGSVDRDLIDWTIAMSGDRSVGAGEISRIARRLSDWPGQDALARNHDRALARGWLADVKLRTAFAANPPQTFEAAYALAKSHLRTGDANTARALFAPYWHGQVLSAAIKREALDLFADALTEDDHFARYFNMMVRERIGAAGRVAAPAGMAGLHDAWTAVIRRAAGVDAMLADVPEDLLETEAGLYMRIEHLRRTDRFEEAAELLEDVPSDPAALTNPDAWWNERRIVSRSLRERGDTARAYAIVARHQGGSPQTQVDAAFHAGWYALRGLDDPSRARPHFEAIEAIAVGPSSRARAAYWLGRTALAAGDEAEAGRHFEDAARHPTAFYGQLAAQGLGRERLALGDQAPDVASAQQDLSRSPVLRAIERQSATGERRYLETLYAGLADALDTPAHYAALAAHAASAGHPAIGLRIAKRGQWRGHDLGFATHPVGAIPSDGLIAPADRALAYAVARQESEFDTNAVSRADARGLLQLLPSTARDLAGRMELSYSAGRLTADPAFNALLGTQYLGEQRGRFGGSYVLTFIAYNAGPGRAREWVGRFGDPTGLSLEDTIDWIEQIPFPETRLYVQKVMENLTVYKARFGLPLTIKDDLTGSAG
ncbi:lytic transglycosylase domain-containing protein [Roseitalea porphyridii]|nr:lytic transglycosylase domain-containing protein [Roseitalea porphyridii]